MRRVIDVADHPNVVLYWNSDTRFDVDEHGSVRSNFDLVSDRIGLVYLHDLTDKEYPRKELVSLLGSTNYAGYCLTQ